MNLTQFVNENGTNFDYTKLKTYIRRLVRFLDNVNSYSSAPLQGYVDSMRDKRRIGCGLMGWGSALYLLRIPFGSAKADEMREELMSVVSSEAYMASIDLAEEKGMFKYCIPELHAQGIFVSRLNLPQEYMEKLKTTGIRNSSLLSMQPNGNSSILANIVSGGIEPVFMPEYIRTVIVNATPEELQWVTPKWEQGEFYETEFFKFAMEGDDQILKGIAKDGTVYKIDKSRGMTKEVLCSDYGVRYLKARGEWDPNAEWASTTTSLSVNDHVNDLKGFAKYVDSAISKTVNLPHDYSFEDFKNLYLDAYNTGYIKGITTYRAGTMMSVLSAKEEKVAEAEDEEIILEEVKLPNSAPASMKVLKAEGKKWYLTVVMNEQSSRPFALFVTTNVHESNVTTGDAVERLLSLAAIKGIPEKHILETILKIKRDNNHTKVARVISLLLRHGVFIKNIVATMDSIEDMIAGSFLFQIKKYLASFIKDGEKIEGEKCPECGGVMVYREGCAACLTGCGYSKCS